jgi:hypothetical protein
MKKVKIYSIHYNREDFIDWQNDSFNHFLKDEFEYIVVNNAKDASIKKSINEKCKNLNIKTIETYSNSGLAGKHHADSLNYIWKNYCSDDLDNYVIFIDGDCFLIKDLNINNFMKDNIFAGPKQRRNIIYGYLTPTIIISNIDKINSPKNIDWEGCCVDGVNLDTGGGFYLYLKDNDIKNKILELKSTWHIKQDNENLHCIPDELINLYDQSYNIEFFGNEFLHYCRSSNWDHQSENHHTKKSEFIKKFIYDCINGDVKAKEHNFQIKNVEYFGWDI